MASLVQFERDLIRGWTSASLATARTIGVSRPTLCTTLDQA